MARTNTRFKTAYNAMLERLSAIAPGTGLPSEAIVAGWLDVSRTIARSVLAELRENGVVAWDGRAKRLLRAPLPRDRFSETELTPDSEMVEKKFLEWLLRRDVAPGTRLNLRDLARRFSVGPQAISDFLIRFARFGLVQREGREGREGWVLHGFTPAYARELSDFRTMIELDAAVRFASLAGDHPVWPRLTALRAEHLALLERIETGFNDFSDLDDRFHRTIVETSGNRFALEFQDLISMVFHYHYQWNKRLERQRNEAAIGEHLVYLDALVSRDQARIRQAAGDHLATARQTLLASTA